MAVWDREDAAGRAETTRSPCPALRRAAVCMTGGCEHKRLLGRGRYLPYPGDVGELEEGEDAEEDFRGEEGEEHGNLRLLTRVRVPAGSPPPCTRGTSIRSPSTLSSLPTSTRRWPRCTSPVAPPPSPAGFTLLSHQPRVVFAGFEDDKLSERAGAECRCLTQALLFRDFHLQLSLPPDRLCPPVPNRLNYVLWIQDIVRAHQYLFQEGTPPIRGIDIGTGASAIYPLLACKMEKRWRMVGTEVDSASFTFAERNVQLNQMENQISVLRASTNGPILFPLENYIGPPYDFIMCNPPFYSSREEISRLADMKELPPNSVCTGADTEMIYAPGGEAAFIGQMVEESERHGDKCRWYTSMIGKLTTISEIIVMLRKRTVRTYALTEFVQGQTRRWGVAWSFTCEHLPDSIARLNISSNHTLHPLQPPRNTLINQFRIFLGGMEVDQLQTFLLAVCDSSDISANERPFILEEEELPLSLQIDPDVPHLSVFRLNPVLVQAKTNTWSRKERRKQQQQQQQTGDERHRDGSTTPQTIQQQQPPPEELICSMQWSFDFGSSPTTVALESQWVYGDDRNLFEGLVSHVARKLGQILEPYSKQPWYHHTPPTQDLISAGMSRGSPSNTG